MRRLNAAPVRAKFCGLFLCGLLAAASPGIRPRPAATDYPSHQSNTGATIGAALISHKEVKKIFATDLNRGGYIVIEVGVYPMAGIDTDLSPADFLLRTEAGRVVRPVDATAIATSLGRSKDHSIGRTSGVYTTADVIVGHGSGVDPATGRPTGRTGVGESVGVGVGPSPGSYPYPASGPNSGAMEQELWEKSLPDGKIAAPVAGYLYFPKPSGKSDGWELTMEGRDGRVRLALPDPEKR
jgi:hypothetical protein